MAHTFVAGDRSKLVVTCKDKGAQAVIDLTGATVRLKFRIDGGSLVTQVMTILSPATAGKAEYQFGAAELSAGVMEAEVEITDATGKVFTAKDLIVFQIRAKL